MTALMEESKITEASPELTKAPKLPVEYFEKSLSKTTIYLAYSFCLYGIPTATIYWAVGYGQSDMMEKIILTVLLGLFAQQGLHLLGWVGHEGFHFNLVSNRKMNALLGLFFSSMIFSHMGLGFALSHWNHHRFTNRLGDPDKEIFQNFHTATKRLLFARLVADWHYMKNAVLTALGKWKVDTKGYPLSQKEQRSVARINILLSLGWGSFYAWLLVRNPIAGLAAIVFPHILVNLLTGLRPYMEHAGTEASLFRTSRTRLSPILSAAYFFNNYHLEHHLYPKVPCYNLPKVHAYLASKGLFEAGDSFIERGFLSNFKYSTSRYQYPASKDSDRTSLSSKMVTINRNSAAVENKTQRPGEFGPVISGIRKSTSIRPGGCDRASSRAAKGGETGAAQGGKIVDRIPVKEL